MVSDPTATRSDRPRWLTVALLVSLAVNLLVVGVIAGHLLSGQRHMWQRPDAMRSETSMRDRPGEMVMRRMAQAVPTEHRAAFEAAMAEHRTQLAEAGRAVRDARMKVRDAMMAEPLDRARLDAAFAELRARGQGLQAALHAAVSDAAAKLPADARTKLAEFDRRGRER